MGIIINGQNDTIGPVDNTMSLLGNVSIGGTMTIEDFTNIDSVGLITARNGLHVTGGNVSIGENSPVVALHISRPLPIIRLQDSDNNDSTALQRVEGVHSGGTTQWFVGQNSTSDTELWIQNVTNDDIRFGTNNTERLRITSAGNIGIDGATAPRAKFDHGSGTGHGTLNQTISNYQAVFESPQGTGNISRNIAFAVGTNGIGAAINAVDNGGNDATGLLFATGTAGSIAERLRITSAGKVGIRTDNPKQVLSVVGRSNFDVQGDYYGAWIDGDSTADSSFNVGSWYNVGGRLRDNGNHVVLESMNTSHYVQLQPSGGNVGVGEAGPNAKLHITKDNDVAYTPSQATQDSNNQIKIENHSTTTDSFVSMAMRARACDFHLGVKNNGADNSGRFFLVHQDTTNKEVVSVLSTGKIGIGTNSPTDVLDILTGSSDEVTSLKVKTQGRVELSRNHASAPYIKTQMGSGNPKIILGDSGGDKVLINGDGASYFNGGDFGIGTSNPTDRLHVQDSSDTGSIRIGGGNGAGNHRIYIQAHPSTAYIDSYGNNTHNPLSINADPLILNNSGSGKVLIATNTNNDNQAKLVVNGMTDCGNVITGRIHDSTNNNNRTVLLFRMNQSQGFQFSGDIIVNSWTGNAKVNCHITVQYQNQNVEVDVVNATHSSQISKTNLRVVTADYGSNRYLGIQKNGGGTGVFYINAFVTGNMESSGNGGIREVNNSSLGSVTNQANLN